MTITPLKLLYHCRRRKILTREVFLRLVDQYLRTSEGIELSIEQSRIAVAVASLLEDIRLARGTIGSLSLESLKNLLELNGQHLASHDLSDVLHIARRIRHRDRNLFAVDLGIFDFVVFEQDLFIPGIWFTPPLTFVKVLQMSEKLIFWLPVISSNGDLMRCDLMILPNDFSIPNVLKR